MHHLTIISLLWIACATVFVQGKTFVPRQRLCNILQVNIKVLPTSTLDIIQVPRGGSIAIDVEEGGFAIKKLRNIVRSILNVGEKKAPMIAKLMKSILSSVESITGIKLLPSDEKETKKKKKDGKSKKELNKQATGTSTKKESKEKATAKAKKDIKKPSAQAQSHLSKELKTSNPNYRIQRELKEFMKSPPPNLSVQVGKNIRVWIVTMKGTKGSLYEGEKYRLRVQFPPSYPTDPPSVYFLTPTPRHEHVYTNGDICLSLLGKDWRPNMTAQSIAMSILSILSGAGRKSLPMDNAGHAQNKPGERQDNWVYHDDNC